MWTVKFFWRPKWDHREADLPLSQRWSSQSHTSKHEAGANTRMPGVFLLIILPSSHLPPLCFGLAHPAPNFIALNAEEQIESNLSVQPAASAAPYWDPSTGCSVPASSLLSVPQLPLDQMKNILINLYLNLELPHALLEISKIALICVEIPVDYVFSFFAGQQSQEPQLTLGAHLCRSEAGERCRWINGGLGKKNRER